MNLRYFFTLALFFLFGCQTPTHETTQTAPVPVTLSPTKQVQTKVSEAQTQSIPPTDPKQQKNLWKRITLQFTLDVPDNERIQTYRNWYLKYPEHIQTLSKRAEPFLYMITTEIEKRKMPLELALLPAVESAFDPFAYSYGSAAGLWQFIPMTADRFGLERNYWYDGRRDVYASTQAALDYMAILAKRFDGNWEQAIAAYNTGGGRVSQAIRKNKKANKPTDFFSLTLPKETESYVPKLLALADILSHPEKYNIQMPEIKNAPVLTLVDPKEQLDLGIAAQYADISIKELQSYNPGFNQWASAPDGPYHFLIPIEKAQRFQQKAKENKGKGIKLARYQVRSGDTLSVIAQKNQTTTALIKTLNQLDNSTIRVGQYLLVPQSTHQDSSYSLSVKNRLEKIQSTPKGNYKTTYTVKAGDNLWDIARNHKVSTEALARWNGLAPKDTLTIGQQLVIWQKSRNSGVTRTVHYKVRNGDTISDIASKFKVKTADIIQWNGLDTQTTLTLGQKLILHVDVTKVNS